MDQKAGAQISKRAFIQSLLILLALMVAAGVLTRVVPTGSYTRSIEGEREIIDPKSFDLVARPNYPIWRWFTAPIEVLWGPDGLLTIVIILFILMVGSAFAVLDKSGILEAVVARVVKALGEKKSIFSC